MKRVGAPKKQWLLDRFLAPVTFGTGPVARLHRFFARDIWLVHPDGLPAVRRSLYRVARVGYLALRGFLWDGCMPRAAALTYITALSIIPMLALSFSVLKGFGMYETLVQETIEPFLDKELGVVADGGELRVALDEILLRVDSTNFGGLGTIGLVIVLWAAMRMLSSVETAFNKIWGVVRSRTLVRRLTDYLSIVIAVPILMVLAVGASAALLSEDFKAYLQGLNVLTELFAYAAPLLGGWLMFTFVYVVMPNTRSSLTSAYIGGLVAFLLWFTAFKLHFRAQEEVASYSVLYAGFAAIPVFLVFIQASWVVVLLGAEVAFAHEHEPDYRGMASFRVLNHGGLELLALRSILRIAETFLDDGRRLPAGAIAAQLGVPPPEVEGVLRTLEADGLVAATEDHDEGSVVFVLSRDPERITIKHVTDALKKGGAEDEALSPAEVASAGDETLDRLLAKLDEELAGSAYHLDLRELVRRSRRDEAAHARAEPLAERDTGVQPS